MELRFSLLNVAEQLAPLQLASHGETRTAGKGVASKCAGVVAGYEMVDFPFNKQGPDGMAATKALRQGEGIRFNTKALVTPERSATTHPHLHLIKDQQDVVGCAEFADCIEDGRVTGIDTTFSLERLD